MNTLHINCFLAAAHFMNFTKAAENIHITQPALSRQIRSLENEIGTSLFIREHNLVRLTEAGSILYEGLEPLMKQYDALIVKALDTASGSNGILNISTATGQSISGVFSKTLMYLWHNNSNLQVQISYYNIADHANALLRGEMDIAIVPDIDLPAFGAPICKRSVRKAKTCLVVPYDHPLADEPNVKLADFGGETFICLSKSESESIATMHKKICEVMSFSPFKRVAPNISTLSLWLESGTGITTLNPWHILSTCPSVKFIEMDELIEVEEFVVWLEDNHNPAIKAFLNALDACNSE
jgi:DNA-binding transcriptional LysR family regulator